MLIKVRNFEACFKHSNFFKVNDPDKTVESRSQPPGKDVQCKRYKEDLTWLLRAKLDYLHLYLTSENRQ